MRQNCAQHQANFPVEVFCFWWLDVYKGKFKKIKERSKNPDFTCLEGCIGSVRRRRKQTGRKNKRRRMAARGEEERQSERARKSNSSGVIRE